MPPWIYTAFKSDNRSAIDSTLFLKVVQIIHFRLLLANCLARSQAYNSFGEEPSEITSPNNLSFINCISPKSSRGFETSSINLITLLPNLRKAILLAAVKVASACLATSSFISKYKYSCIGFNGISILWRLTGGKLSSAFVVLTNIGWIFSTIFSLVARTSGYKNSYCGNKSFVDWGIGVPDIMSFPEVKCAILKMESAVI